jgi:hypothetical protein
MKLERPLPQSSLNRRVGFKMGDLLQDVELGYEVMVLLVVKVWRGGREYKSCLANPV